MSDASRAFDATALSARLEAARSVIETKFLNAGEMLSQVVDGIGTLLATMETLTQALSPETSAATTRQLADTASHLSELPARQADRQMVIGQLVSQRAGLTRSVEDMRRSLAYMRAFTVSIRIAAGGITRADQEFDVFAQEMSARVEAGRAEVDGLEASLLALQRELHEAATQAEPLERRCAEMIPAVPDQLLASAAIIGQHNRQITAATANSMALARDTNRKVARMLGALQIGDITRQRIEHVQVGLAALVAIDPSIPAEAQGRIRSLIRRLLTAALDSTVEDFNREVAQLSLGLTGLARDASALLELRNLVYGGDDDQAGGFLRNLEQRIGNAVRLVTGSLGAPGGGAVDQDGCTVHGAQYEPEVVASGGSGAPAGHDRCGVAQPGGSVGTHCQSLRRDAGGTHRCGRSSGWRRRGGCGRGRGGRCGLASGDRSHS
jgi:hypothetical protein